MMLLLVIGQMIPILAMPVDFLNNTISVNQLSQAMKLGELGEQVVLKSENAFAQIRFLGYEIADIGI